MPTYMYVCLCGNRWEQKASYDDHYMRCPKCDYMAQRWAAYKEQYINCDTGPKLTQVKER